MSCQHPIVYMGTHPSFRQGWFCPECREYLDMNQAILDGQYGVLLAAVKGANHADEDVDGRSEVVRKAASGAHVQ